MNKGTNVQLLQDNCETTSIKVSSMNFNRVYKLKIDNTILLPTHVQTKRQEALTYKRKFDSSTLYKTNYSKNTTIRGIFSLTP
jgi:hypothetical protein